MRKLPIVFPVVFAWIFIALCFAASAQPRADSVTSFSLEVLGAIAHDETAFTQGLLYHRGTLYESNGLYGESSIRAIDAGTGRVLKNVPVSGYFAEGLCLWKNHLVQLTWKGKKALVRRLSDFSVESTFFYETEGWGLTSDDSGFIMSDGSDRLYFRDPRDFHIRGVVKVTLKGEPLNRLNELEFARGTVFANVWYEPYIVSIDPESGRVTGIVDASVLFDLLPPMEPENVLNGIAYDPDNDIFFITGKRWPLVFRVKIS